MKLSDYVIDFFVQNNVFHAFVVSGGAAVHLIDSCRKHPRMSYICSQHEQHAAAEADMYSRVTKNLGLAITTSGPGATNILTSICNAFFDSIPMVCLTGQVATFRLRPNVKLRQKGFQETDIESIFASITKYTKLIKDPKMIRYELEKAVYLAKSGRPGPVILDIPDDLQRVEINPDELMGFSPEEKCCTLDISQMKRLKNMLQMAEKPLLIFGAGVHAAEMEKEAVVLAEQWQIPVLLTWGAKDLLSADHNLNAGVFGVCGPRAGNYAVQNADLLVIMGSRLSQMNTGGKQNLFAPHAQKVMIDIDEAEITKFNETTVTIDLPICCDLKDFFTAALQIRLGSNENILTWNKVIKHWANEFPICPPSYKLLSPQVNPYVFLEVLSDFLKEDDVVIADTGANVSWTMQTLRVKKGQRIFSAWNHTPMGYSLPASIGASIGLDNSQVICIIGDGGLMMCLQELGTAVRNRLPIKIFLFNNQGHGIQKQTMDTWLNSQYSAVNHETGLFFPDYRKIAESFGIAYFEINNHLEIASKLKSVLSYENVCFCNVLLVEDQKIVPMLKFGKGLEDLDPPVTYRDCKDLIESFTTLQGGTS